MYGFAVSNLVDSVVKKGDSWARGFDEVFMEHCHNPYFNCFSSPPTTHFIVYVQDSALFPSKRGLNFPPLPHAPVKYETTSPNKKQKWIRNTLLTSHYGLPVVASPGSICWVDVNGRNENLYSV